MSFYPVYRIDRSTGSFTRIGSLPESCLRWGVRTSPYLHEQATAVFSRMPGDVIVLGPRCVGAVEEAAHANGR